MNKAQGMEQAISYFRRAVRPNELFFVIPVSETPRIAELCRKDLQ